MGDSQKEGPSSPEQPHREASYTSWQELARIIESNELSKIQREPSQLSRYQKWTSDVKAEYGSIPAYLLSRRLPRAWGTPPFSPASAIPFKDPSDYRVLLNDWLYGFPSSITHMIVWTRTPIPTESAGGDMTIESRVMIAAFVQQYFMDKLTGGGRDQVLWFRNWGTLRSVSAIPHIHVLVREVDPRIVEEWTRAPEVHLV